MVTQQLFFGLFRNLYSSENIYKFTDRLHLQIKFDQYKKNTEYSFLRYEISSVLSYLHDCTSNMV